MNRPTSRRTVLTAAIAAAAAAGAVSSAGSATAAAPPHAPSAEAPAVDNRFWHTYTDWRSGSGAGTRVVAGRRPGLVIGHAEGRTDYTDPHTGTTATWEYATWTSPVHRSSVPATEVIASWNAQTPAGTWIQIELQGRYSDGAPTPWYVMGRWAAGDGDIRRTSVDDQSDGKSSIWTDTFSVDDAASGLRLVSYRLRLTLYRTPGSRLTPTVRRIGAMASDVPDRFTVPAGTPGLVRELRVPRYSQNVHAGQYPEYDNGGEAWCSPTSSQMIIEYWGRRPTAEDLAWVKPGLADPQVCHAARFTYDYQYEGCGNWPFNAAYAATYDGMSSAVTRLGSLRDLEKLIRAGIPAITSQSFLKEELTGAGYGTSGHLMTVIGFTEDGDVIANDPASPDNEAVRRIYQRREWENIWLRTKRYDANGKVRSGTGGVCYLYWPARPAPSQHRVLKALGLL
ncbi:peptidase C39 family protein [Streptomyces sp. NBC_00825]|uniref:peptidase C39 family protein n=1 Tax=unclassified Streptomyces TaxID=2593676 RepID=UPI002ED03B9A|nr:peptidase C39 family protein [Streptomyces sp. NBC_00826]WTH93994.1 peptidase C39 family protein [Streptomyces sp. NBC_00825]WTI02729.1 peptidase C39 family protein [Streptomyces sp. NBC_00822]